MITTAFEFITFVVVCLGIYLWVSIKYENCKLFKYIPPLVFMYVFFVCCTNFGVFYVGEGSVPQMVRKTVTNYCVPLLVYAVIIQCAPRKILKLGPKLLMCFFVCVVSMWAGCFISGFVFKDVLSIPDIPETFGTLCASFIGGPENLFAVANAVSLSDAAMANCLILIELVYSPWLIFLMAGLPALWTKFNKWVNADLTPVLEAGDRISVDDKEKRPINVFDIYKVVGVGLLLELICMKLGDLTNALIPSFPSGVMMYIYLTIGAMILASYTNLGKNPLAKPLSTTISCLLVAMGTLGVDLSYFKGAGWLLAASVLVIVIHAVVMIIYAKITKTDLYTLGCVSIATVGGNSSAPVVAACYEDKSGAYVPMATLFAACGSICGTVGGLVIVKLLSLFC